MWNFLWGGVYFPLKNFVGVGKLPGVEFSMRSFTREFVRIPA
jgi:hypothetical protein